MIAIDLSKQKGLDADPKATRQVSFTGYIEENGNIAILFIIEEAKETA